MKLEEMREKSIVELKEEVVSLKKKLFELRMAKALQKNDDPSLVSKTKKQIAQIKTIISEKELAN
ncbi:MAG: 50S ribosomal protein L29 [Candidatus Gastranaerophilales bacterium]|nr:50S ribosomal protein L29 [Candidatus Gastranaerophilales bacterium]